MNETTLHDPSVSEDIRISSDPSQGPQNISDNRSERLQEVAKYNPKMVSAFKKAYEGKSRVAAMKAKCMDCSAYQYTEIKECTAVECPLWEWRPVQ